MATAFWLKLKVKILFLHYIKTSLQCMTTVMRHAYYLLPRYTIIRIQRFFQ